MVHFSDNFWTSEPKNIHNFDVEQTGSTTNKQSISQCTEVRPGKHFHFNKAPCWQEGTINNMHFSIKPFYTAYRNNHPKGDKTSCDMGVYGSVTTGGSNWDMMGSGEADSAKYWDPPPYTQIHEYGVMLSDDYMDLVKAVRPDAVQNNKGEIKKISYNLGCMSGDTPGASGDALYYYSRCKAVQCLDFMTKPCYDNVYRYDEMVCSLIQNSFRTAVTFKKFVQDIVPEQRYRDAFMAYGSSYFQISFDSTNVQVTKNNVESMPPNQPVAFTLTDTIRVSLKELMSCDQCRDMPLHGRVSRETVLLYNIVKCRKCLLYEKINEVSTYRDCKLCAKHQVRNPDDPAECRKCNEIDALAPMRRAAPHPQTDPNCTMCQYFQYFNENTEQGCEFLQTVTDNIVVANNKAALSGKDYYIKDEIRKEIDAQFYRDNILPGTDWNRELEPKPCSPGFQEPGTLVKRLRFTAWCGHREMVRHQQAWLRLRGGMLYLPLNSDEALTHVNTSVVGLCGSAALTRVQGNITADLACGQHIFTVIRSGFQDPCTLCLGARYTKNCWPTYVGGLTDTDAAYFADSKAAPQPGTCAACNARCDNYLQADNYIDPVEYSCWWNGVGRIPGLLGSTATNYSWYKPAPCTKCDVVTLTADLALLVLACGNRISYRRWTDTVTGSDLDASISVPTMKICCAEALAGSSGPLCTDKPAEFETFAREQCRQTVDDTPPATLAYCPPLWYVDPACAHDSPLWNPDCCVKCKSCRGGKFKTDAYYDCPGNQFFDSQDRGCTTKCLTNQYLRNERCIKCEACE